MYMAESPSDPTPNWVSRNRLILQNIGPVPDRIWGYMNILHDNYFSEHKSF